MTSTIDLAKKAGFHCYNGCADGIDVDLERFRALCVAEEHKRLLGVGIAEPDPEAVKRFGPPTYTAEQLAAARLQGQEEGKQMAQRGVVDKRIAELEQALATVKKSLTTDHIEHPLEMVGQERSKREPLTADELWLIWNSQGDDYMSRQEIVAFARAVEKRHGIGEQG